MFRATRLMILGATHLGRGDQREPDEALQSIVDRLVRWEPDALAIEALPGELVDYYLRLGGPFADMRVGGLPQATACAEAVRELHSWDLWEARDAGQDRTRELTERVVAWCAAFEPFTALLLARRASGLPAPVRAALAEVEAGGDERNRIAGKAAARLGLERLHPFDDHGIGPATNAVSEEALEASIRELHAKARDHPMVTRDASEVSAAFERGDLWPLWRHRNSPEVVADSDGLESGLYLEHGKGPLEAALATDQWDLDIADISELDG